MCIYADFKRSGGQADTANGKLAGATVLPDTGSAGMKTASSAYILMPLVSIVCQHTMRLTQQS